MLTANALPPALLPVASPHWFLLPCVPALTVPRPGLPRAFPRPRPENSLQ